MIRVGKDLYWLNVRRERLNFPDLVQAALDARDEYGLPLCIEDYPFSRPLIQTLQTRVSGVIPFKIEGRSKEARAQAATPYAEAGNFYLPRKARWVGDFIEEHAGFPNAAHDDQVDTTSMAALRLLSRGMPIASTATYTRGPQITVFKGS